ncbi:hypothetical protein L1987_37486 [Smallanthus sonchifolius]|uniref:Uncharacterized protein n=1 Tax=Smallanthus sonchifolius TaxID=185202 RepID=A0ACB9HHV4_9ASTR|nr:hypothetical protein L1987_37486 [Smallanthus sonchifolius]
MCFGPHGIHRENDKENHWVAADGLNTSSAIISAVPLFSHTHSFHFLCLPLVFINPKLNQKTQSRERIFVCVRDRNLKPNISMFQGCVG